MIQTLTFEAIGGKTLLTIRTRFESVAIRDAMVKLGMTEGWTKSLERFEALVATAGYKDAEGLLHGQSA